MFLQQKRHSVNIHFFSALFLSICSTFAENNLYRVIGKDLICDPASVIDTIAAHSLSTCAMACKGKPGCGMFAVEHVYENTTQNDVLTRRNVKMECLLCKSANMSSVIESIGWSVYIKWLKDIRFNVLDTDNKTMAPDTSPLETWSIDCNMPEITDKRNGVLVGIWDDKDNFRDLDKVKCFNWDAEELFSNKPSRLLYIHLEDYRQCPKDYVLTAITASNAAFRNVDNGKCTPLDPRFHVDYDQCVTVDSDGKDGGPSDEFIPWKVQCPSSGPMVAVSLHRRRRIHTGLKCCVLKGLFPDSMP